MLLSSAEVNTASTVGLNSLPIRLRDTRIVEISLGVAYDEFDSLRVAHLAVLYSGQTPDKVRHIDQQTPHFLHMISVVRHDLVNGINTSLQRASNSARKASGSDTHETSKSGLPIHSRINRRPIFVLA